MGDSQSADAIVVGGGIIGLAVAWRARQRGMDVTLLDRGLAGAGTSRVAAGMLGPVSEVEFGDAGRRLLDLGLRSADLWPTFAAELEEAVGSSVGLLRTGTMLVARDEDDARELERQLHFRGSIGLAVSRLLPSEARALEPALAPTVRLALDAPDDHSVDPRLVLTALLQACLTSGVDVREHTPVASVDVDAAGERVSGVTLADGQRLSAERVVLAAGPWTEAIDGLPGYARVPVRPVKGQILRLRDPAGPGLLGRVLRFDGGYIVPRGAEHVAPTAGGVYQLLRDARELLPGIAELEIEELSAGLRPGTPDNAPVIGPGALDGLVWATGHYRNGILLAPLTAALVAGTLAGEQMPDPLRCACAPERFTAVSHRSLSPAGPPVGALS
jgi:glycine oxidase